MKIKVYVCMVVMGWLLMAGANAFSQDVSIIEGRALFQTNCGACHHIHKEIVGPALASITKKRNPEWLLKFIQNSQQLIADGDPYAGYIYERYHHQVMPSFRELTAENVKGILHFIEIESMNPPNDIPSGLDVIQQSEPAIFHGQLIFEQQCAACHFLDHEGSYGPALSSVTKRHSTAWLTAFIRNSQEVIQSGDPYAKYLFDRFDQRIMVPMPFLKDEDIADVLRYIDYRSSSDHSTAGASGRERQFAKKTSEIHSNYTERPIQGAGFLIGIVVMLLLTGFTIYGFTIRRLFRYLQKK